MVAETAIREQEYPGPEQAWMGLIRDTQWHIGSYTGAMRRRTAQ